MNLLYTIAIVFHICMWLPFVYHNKSYWTSLIAFLFITCLTLPNWFWSIFTFFCFRHQQIWCLSTEIDSLVKASVISSAYCLDLPSRCHYLTCLWAKLLYAVDLCMWWTCACGSFLWSLKWKWCHPHQRKIIGGEAFYFRKTDA